MSNLLINEPPLMVLPTLATVTSLNEAILLQQIHYWLDPRGNKNTKEGKHWVYNTYKDWEKQFPFWSQKTIERIILSLETRGILISKQFNKQKGDKTKWYTIDYKQLESINPPSRQVDVMGKDKMTGPSRQVDVIINKETETTSENTSSLNPSSKGVEPLEEEKKLQEMIKYWTHLIQEGEVVLNKDRRKKLLILLEGVFDGNMTRWKKYLQKIASSKFLMGATGFSINLDWVMKEATIQKVLGGGYTTGDREVWAIEEGEEEREEVKKWTVKAQRLLKEKPEYWEKGIKGCYFLYVKNLGEGREVQKLLRKEGFDHPKIQRLFDAWVRGLEGIK